MLVPSFISRSGAVCYGEPLGGAALPIEPQAELEELADLLSRAADWRRENMPEIDTPQGYLLLLWLLKHKLERRPLISFYESGHFSEPTMRKAVKAFTERGLAIVEFDEEDARCRVIRGTSELTALAEEYSRLLTELATRRVDRNLRNWILVAS